MTEQRVAVVTGASSGIGRAIAVRFARQGIRVVAAGRNADELAKLAGELPELVRPVCGDVTDPGHPERLLAAAEKWEPASILVVSAGHGLPGTVLGSDPDGWRDLVEVNYLAVLRQLRVGGEYFTGQAERDNGRRVRDIVVIGSTAGRQVSAANPVYGSTKFAVHSLVEALRQEVCAHNIRVTLIEPGFVRSGFQETAGYDMAWFDKVTEDNGPLLTPDDVAETVGFVVDRPAHVHLDDIRLRPTRQRV
ncbi:SDR family oxidoreductase [Actinoplanes oblitus]|uniref:SDR family oxidoreductase n=1 Tax=Actinoplanes oblitus TaxID=3040509 RepID=A0ABY8WSJ3_9ACTN|nr:SDR family oxidoreductase [Actinoplanes oblitus]WIM99830.1 SDR family oxidoreductase [Actinoplanes oblitus]